MAFNPILRITDGTTTVNLIESKGWLLDEWKPAIAEPKGGGVFRNSPLTDGRKLAYRKMDNITDTFNLIGSKDSQNEMITSIQELERLLEKATSYWTSNWQNEPVWIEARAANETYSRYATIVDYRLSGFGGPFRQPFFSSDCNSATEAILVIEHMLWQETEPGEDGTCVQLSSQFYASDASNVSSGTFNPSASAYDGTYSPSLTEINLNGNTIQVGYTTTYGGNCIAGILFDNVTVPAGAFISSAILTLGEGDTPIGSTTILVCGQDPRDGDAIPFDGTVDDFLDRIPNTADPDIPVQIVSLINEGYPLDIDVTNIARWIVGNTGNVGEAPSGWDSGDIMGFFIKLYSGTSGREFDSDDSGFPADLYIEYSTSGVYYGRSATCLHEVYVGNKQNTGLISHVYIYDADGAQYDEGGTKFSNNLLTQALPYDLLPDAPAVGDMLYFCSYDGSAETFGPFCSGVFDLSTAQSGVSGIWEYYDTDLDWTELDLCGDAETFSYTGVCSVIFEPESGHAEDHSETTGDGVITGYWIRFRVTAVSTPSPPIQANRHIYTVNNAYVDIDSLQIPGDIPALSRILFDAAACGEWSIVNTIVVGLRTLSRGDDFSAYLNASDIQNPFGMTFDYEGIMEENGGSITGHSLYLGAYVPTTSTWDNICNWTITGDLGKQYIGEYHAYVRGMFNALHVGTTKLRLRAVFGDECNTSYSDIAGIKRPSATNDELIDMGKLSIQPTTTMRPNDTIDFIKIYLDSYDEDVYDWVLCYIYDVVLIPADEWIGCFSIPAENTLHYGKGVDIDAITNPRQYRAVETTINDPLEGSGGAVVDLTDRSIAAEMSRVSSGEPIFQANTDQRLWFTQYYNFSGGITFTHQNCGKISAQRSARYLYARGSR